jgi:ABC-type nitrate/sulfonate/bicarbonate transport system ATPase subunit
VDAKANARRQQPKIALRAVSKNFGSGAGAIEAIRHVDLSISEGEIYCLLGPSGCGKTTVLNMIAGFEHPTDGTVAVDAEIIRSAGPDRAVVFQQPTLYPWLNVMGNIMLGLRFARIPRSEASERAHSYVVAMGLSGFEKRYPYELSGGMQQRVALGRAWINEPRVLLLDEPFGALDALTRVTMQELLLDLWARFATTILFITHDVEEAIFLGDKIGIMSGRPSVIVEEISVNIPRPRTIETTTTPRFIEIKRTIIEQIRCESGIK